MWQYGVCEVGTGRPRIKAHRPFSAVVEKGPREVRAAKIRSTEIRAEKYGNSQRGIGEVCIAKVRPECVDILQVSTAKTCSSKTRPVQT